MTDPLRSEILVPASAYTRRTLLAALGTTALGAAIGLAASPASSSSTVAFVPVPHAEIVQVEAPVVAQETAQPVRTSDVSLVFSAGGATYMKLADIGDEAEVMPEHGTPKLYTDDYVQASIATVKASELSDEYSAWQGRADKVDATCDAKVTGFAVVARLTGDTGYSGIEDGSWTASNVLENGSVELAAKLDGCTGTFARDASLPAIVVLEQIENAKLAKEARALLVASTPAQDAQDEYAESEQKGNWWDNEYATFATKIVRHPTTGVTWVSVHGSVEHGCGDPEINVWGLFRVEADGSLAAVQLRNLGDLWSIDKLVDLDNDGELEVIGKPWLGLDTVVARGSGEELDRLSLAFFGCPC